MFVQDITVHSEVSLHVPKTDILAWMLIEWYHDCRVLAESGEALPYAVDACIGWQTLEQNGVASWLERELQHAAPRPCLIPLAGELWFVFPDFHRATGLLWLVRLPVSPTAVLTLSDTPGNTVRHFPALTVNRFPHEEELERAEVLWQMVMDCLPHPMKGSEHGENVAEMTRLLRAVARAGQFPITVRSSSHSQEQIKANLAPVLPDLPLFTVQLLLLLGDHRRIGSRVTAAFPRLSEGQGISLTIHYDEQESTLAEKLAICCDLADRYDQLFDFVCEKGVCRCLFCAIRKEYSLLGVKTDRERVAQAEIEREMRRRLKQRDRANLRRISGMQTI